MDRIARRHALVALRIEGEVDHHDRVLLDDADQQDDADDGDDVELMAEMSSASSAPIPAEGRVERIVTGWTKLS